MSDKVVFLPGRVNEEGKYEAREDSVYGILCIEDRYRNFNEPVLQISYYPILFRAHRERYTHLIGQEAWYRHDGRYAVGSGDSYVTLVDGGKTKPIHYREEPIPPPKTRVETRYQYGRWEKYLQGKGWVNA